MAQAFACDVTRFGTLVMNDLPWDSPNNATHGRARPRAALRTCTTSSRTSTRRAAYDWENKLARTGDPATWLPLAKYNKYVYGKVARLMQTTRRARRARQRAHLRDQRAGQSQRCTRRRQRPDGARGRRERAVPLRPAAPD